MKQKEESHAFFFKKYIPFQVKKKVPSNFSGFSNASPFVPTKQRRRRHPHFNFILLLTVGIDVNDIIA